MSSLSAMVSPFQTAFIPEPLVEISADAHLVGGEAARNRRAANGRTDMAGGVAELKSKFLGTLRVELAETHFLGDTPAGWRRIDVFRGGTLTGPRINARILSGGSDSLLRRRDGAMQPDVRLTV